MRRGFTVVELLVVIAIIAVLMGLIIPAVQFAREASRKGACSNNLRQIAMAALAHNTAFDHFPNAGGKGGMPRSVTSSGTPRRSVEQDWGVFYQILPYLEQQGAYEASPTEAAALKLKLYFCPTRRAPTTVSGSTDNGLPASAPRGGVDYAGNGGAGGRNLRNPSDTHLYVFPDLAHQSGVIIPRPNADGAYNELVTTAAIRDGLTNVIMFGERWYDRRPGMNNSPGEMSGYFNGWSIDTIRFGHQRPPHSIWPPHPGTNSDVPAAGSYLDFGGAHPGICLFALCDGSVRPMRYGTMDTATFRQITDRADNVRNASPSPQF
jgi:prepilin-type N-terminal cleavage/methylation domain-containing protein